jgi:adenine/guanine/hypoxanthine permease
MVRPRHEDGHRGIGYVVVMTATGRAREVHPLMWAIAPFFVAFFAADWLEVNVF